jgi:hypothetical protein
LKVRLQSEICALQDRCSRLLGWALDVRAAANKPMPARLITVSTAAVVGTAAAAPPTLLARADEVIE